MSRDILLSLIDPDPSQPRKTFDEGALDELAQSMAANGLAVAVLVRPAGDRYLLVHGERRWRAAGRLGWAAIPAEVRDVAPEQARWLALVENIQRADLSPIEEAGAYQAALSEGLTQTELGKRIGKSQSYIAQKLRLLTLPAPLQVYLDRRALSEGHARQLLRLRNFYGPDLPAAAGRWQEAWAPCLDAAYWQEPCMVFALLRDLRPLDQPPAFFADLLTDKGAVDGALSAGCHALSVWWAEAGRVPQWAVVAFWYGAFAAHYSISVGDLTTAIHNFLELLYAAITFAHPIRSDKNRQGKLEAWGCLSDLRHAGLWQDGKKCVPMDLELKALESVLKQESHALPSNCQSHGAGAAAWEYAGLKDSIAEHGVLMPVQVDEKGNILDGRKRVKAWKELRAEGVNVPEYPRFVYGGMSEEDKRDHRAELNKPRLPQPEQEVMIGGRSYAGFMQEVTDLKERLDEAQDLPEVKAIIDQAADLQREAAEFTLDNQRAAGQALLELKAAEAAQP